MLLQPALQGATRRVLADDHHLPVIDVGFDNRQHVRVPAHLRPDESLLFEGFNIHVLIASQLEGEARRGNGCAFFGQPYDAEAAAPELADQCVRTDFTLGLLPSFSKNRTRGDKIKTRAPSPTNKDSRPRRELQSQGSLISDAGSIFFHSYHALMKSMIRIASAVADHIA